VVLKSYIAIYSTTNTKKHAAMVEGKQKDFGCWNFFNIIKSYYIIVLVVVVVVYYSKYIILLCCLYYFIIL